MNTEEQRLERIEDSILELAEAMETAETFDLYRRIGDILFEATENENE